MELTQIDGSSFEDPGSNPTSDKNERISPPEPIARALLRRVSPHSSIVNIVGRSLRSERGKETHFCMECDLPIAFYGRVIPCEHAFCLSCAKGNSNCLRCGESIESIQKIEMLSGLCICEVPECNMKSFLSVEEFELHNGTHHSS